MPILSNRKTGDLSPLEEEPGAGDSGDSVMEGRGCGEEGGGERGGLSVFTTLGTTILTSRPYQVTTKMSHASGASLDSHRASLQGEIFQSVTKESLPTMQNQMESLWNEGIPMCIEVKGQATPTTDDSSSILLEQWLVQVLPRRSHSPPIPPSLLTHAVQSFLHFSQIHSWIVSHKDSLPFDLTYRVCAPGEDSRDQFTLHHPEQHTFPPALLTPHSSLQVSVRHLPRLKEIPSLLAPSVTKPPPPPPPSSPQRDVVERFRDLSLSDSTHHKPFTSSQGIPSHPPHHPSTSPSSHHSQEVFPFSPPQPSPMSPKLLAGLGESPQYKSLIGRDRRICGREGQRREQEEQKVKWLLSGENFEGPGVGEKEGRGGQELEGRSHASSIEVPRSSFYFDTGCVGRGGGEGEDVQREGGEWVGVRTPAASSPVPFMRRCLSESQRKHISSAARRSSAINIKGVHPTRLSRSNSAPATMPSLCLLGTFEESVLNGRLDPCGFVEGFTAELGASGSFCPRHMTFPVTAAFYNLSHSGTSPYFGVVDLSNTGKRGYHIPKKGTVQLTLFNPNRTVVKIFVVNYDLSDMPPNSQTFLRQKIISRPHPLPPNPSPPLLHYLIHLRFLCSKSGRVYLHRDIRLIFARRAPDLEPDLSQVSLLTLTEAPPSPKYGPLDGQRGGCS